MDKYPLPVWLQGPRINALKTAADNWWQQVENWLKLPLNQLDAETCHPIVLQFLAYQRDVDRFFAESDELFKKRVKFAIENAKDAGSTAGFQRIFDRLGVDLSEQIERDPAKDFDVITLKLGSSAVTASPELGHYIIRQYGRTCRRYEFFLEDRANPVTIGAAWASVDRMSITVPVHPLLPQIQE